MPPKLSQKKKSQLIISALTLEFMDSTEGPNPEEKETNWNATYVHHSSRAF